MHFGSVNMYYRSLIQNLPTNLYWSPKSNPRKLIRSFVQTLILVECTYFGTFPPKSIPQLFGALFISEIKSDICLDTKTHLSIILFLVLNSCRWFGV